MQELLIRINTPLTGPGYILSVARGLLCGNAGFAMSTQLTGEAEIGRQHTPALSPSSVYLRARRTGDCAIWETSDEPSPAPDGRQVEFRPLLLRCCILARRPIIEGARRLHLLDVAFGPTADAGYQTNERLPQVR